MTSWTVDDLRRHLQAAVELELLVIPPYLCALYSLHPGTNAEAALVVRSVVVEEMLHMILAANVLNAVGGRPTVADPDWVPRYPAAIPYHEPESFQVGLLPFGDPALDVFLAIENPSYPVGRPQAAPPDAAIPRAMELSRERGYRTVGAFYEAIQEGLFALDEQIGAKRLFCGDRARQIGPEHYYASGGHALVVHDLDTALVALEQIIDQGEGELRESKPSEKVDDEGNLAHYYRFNELRRRRRYRAEDAPADPTGPPIQIDLAAIYPMKPNLRVEQLPTNELRAAARTCNRVYARMLGHIQTAFDGKPDALTHAVGTMFELRNRAVDLLRIPLPGDGVMHAGPTFEYPIDGDHAGAR
jgi:hypothetical protein